MNVPTLPMQLALHSSPALASAIADLRSVACVESAAEFLEHVLELFELGLGFVCAVSADLDGLAAVRAGDAVVVVEPTEALLELAAAARAGNFEFRVKHGVAP
jgi:hypothetical protein